MMELPLLRVLALVSVLAVERTDELGDRPLLRGMTGAGRATGRGACRRPWPWRPAVLSCSTGLPPGVLRDASSSTMGNGWGEMTGMGCQDMEASPESMVESSSGRAGMRRAWGLITSVGAGMDMDMGTVTGVGWRKGSSIESISTISVDGSSVALASTARMLRES